MTLDVDLAGDLIVKGLATLNYAFRKHVPSASSKNPKRTCETQQTAPLAVDCTPTLKSATQNHQRTKYDESLGDSCALCDSRFLSVC